MASFGVAAGVSEHRIAATPPGAGFGNTAVAPFQASFLPVTGAVQAPLEVPTRGAVQALLEPLSRRRWRCCLDAVGGAVQAPLEVLSNRRSRRPSRGPF